MYLNSTAVNANKANGFDNAVNAAVKRLSVKGVQFTSASNGTIGFETATGDRNMVACVVAIDKQ